MALLSPSGTPARTTPAQQSADAAPAWVALLFLVAVPVLAHLRYSWMGFSPTDEGVVLALARRLLLGQVPHLDFIAIRPVGSALLHLPEAAFGGDRAFWLSRFAAWIEYALIAWSGVAVVQRWLRLSWTGWQQVSAALLAFCYCAHIFPAMAWHTVDALLLAMLGLWLCAGERPPNMKACGYVLLGAAVLCRQNFALLLPLALLLQQDWRQLKYWLAVGLPALTYAIFLLAMGAFPAAVTQFSVRTELFTTGVHAYMRESALAGLALGILYGVALGSTKRTWARLSLTLLALFAAVLGANMTLLSGQFVQTGAFALFGMGLGITMICAVYDRGFTPRVRLGLLLLAVAWSASISLGYNTPALASGLVALLPVSYLSSSLPGESRPARRLLAAILPLLALASLLCFDVARHRFLYRDAPAAQLTSRLDGVWYGGRGIRTNANTSAFLRDLRTAVAIAGSRPYAIIPDLAGYWAEAERPNPLPIDWASAGEAPGPGLQGRVRTALRQRDMIVIVQRVAATSLAQGFHDFSPVDPHYGIVFDVRREFRKVGETRYFELYQAPTGMAR